MKFAFVLGIAILMSTMAQAQLKARTSDGREVVLHDDGTWEFVEQEEAQESSSGPSVVDNINEHCEEKWGTDFSMQEYCRGQQMEAARNLSGMMKSMPSEIGETRWNQIFTGCAAKWQTDYSMIEYCTNNQLEALRKLR